MRSCRPRPDVGGRKHAHVGLRRAATSCDGTQYSRTRSTLRNSTPTRRRSVAVRRQSTHVARDPATDRLPFDARALMSPEILRPISYRSTPENSCRQRSCDRSVGVRHQSAHVASDPATDQLPFDARALMSPEILRPIDRRPTSERSCRQRSCVRSVTVRRQRTHVARDPATDRSASDIRALMSPAILRPISCRSTPERSCRQRSCDRSIGVRHQSAHVASDPATDQLPFDARALMSPEILRLISCRSTSERSCRQRSCDRSVGVRRS